MERNRALGSPTTMKSRRVTASVTVLAAASVLSGCGDATRDSLDVAHPSTAEQGSPGLTEPPGKQVSGIFKLPRKLTPVDPGDPFSPTVVWKGSILIVTAFGSSSCPPLAAHATVIAEQLLLIDFTDPPEQACTDDYAASVSRIPAPEGEVEVQREISAVYDLEGAQRSLIAVRLIRPEQS